ncbi:MAG TPA: hypothetical protein VF100_08780, partial [Thermoanaerobaculia bacterium]
MLVGEAGGVEEEAVAVAGGRRAVGGEEEEAEGEAAARSANGGSAADPQTEAGPAAAGAPRATASAQSSTTPRRSLAFSLFFFSADGSSASGDRYRLLLDAARFADEHGFAAVWTP